MRHRNVHYYIIISCESVKKSARTAEEPAPLSLRPSVDLLSVSRDRAFGSVWFGRTSTTQFKDTRFNWRCEYARFCMEVFFFFMRYISIFIIRSFIQTGLDSWVVVTTGHALLPTVSRLPFIYGRPSSCAPPSGGKNRPCSYYCRVSRFGLAVRR